MNSAILNLPSKDEVEITQISIDLAMNEPFRIHLVVTGRDDIDLKQTGKPASFTLGTGRGHSVFSSVVEHISHDGPAPNRLATYTVLLAPSLLLLQHRVNHRLFQQMSALETAVKLLGEWGIRCEQRITGHHPKLDLRTQYGETDYDFLRRLLAESGISFFFEPGASETKLVLSDAPESQAAHPIVLPFAHQLHSISTDHVSDVSLHSKLHPAHVSVADFDFRRPHSKQIGHHKGAPSQNPMLERYQFAPGHSLAGDKNHEDISRGRAKLLADSLRSEACTIAFTTSLLDLIPGLIFSIQGHPHPEVAEDKELLVTRSWLHCDGASGWMAGGSAVRRDKTYRPPVVKLPKPLVQGVHTATVAGPHGETIHTEPHGRVRVHFPWDRESHANGQSSPWLRVSQKGVGASAGNGNIPHVGTEVVVGYHGGDPDHPVVMGRVQNATTPTPYTLPGNKDRSTWKGAGAEGNEITFDDRAGQELFYVQADRDLHKIVLHDELEHTVGNRHITIDGDLHIGAGGKLVLQAKVVHAPTLVQGGNGGHPQKPPQLSTGKPKPAPKPATGKSGKGAYDVARSLLGQDTENLKYHGPLAGLLDTWVSDHQCCANFVSACLEKAGLISKSEHRDLVGPTVPGAANLADTLAADPHWSKTSLKDAQPGDVICFDVPGEGHYMHTEMFAGWQNGQPMFIGSNNVNSDGSQRVSEGSPGYPIDAIFHYHG